MSHSHGFRHVCPGTLVLTKRFNVLRLRPFVSMNDPVLSICDVEPQCLAIVLAHVQGHYGHELLVATLGSVGWLHAWAVEPVP